MKTLKVVPYFLIIFFTVVMIITATVVFAAPPTQYKEVATTGTDLNGKVFVDSDATGFNTYLEDGIIIISGHGQKTVKLKWISLKNSVKTLNGHTIKVQHRNDAGVIDSSVTYDFDAMEDTQGFVYFDAEFSEVIIGGFQGSYTKTDSTLYNNMTNFSYGQSFTNMTSVTFNATQGYDSALDKYNFTASLNPVGWWKLDGNANDSSEHANNGVFPINYTDEPCKYNNGTNFSLSDDGIIISNSNVFNVSENGMFISFSFILIDKPVSDYKRVFYRFAGGTPGYGYGVFVRSNGRIRVDHRTNTTGDSIAIEPNIDYADGEVHVFSYYVNSTEKTGYMYIDNALVGSDSYINELTDSNTNLIIGDDLLPIIMDNVVFYNFTITETERNNLYYDPVQELRVRTNSNSTWSDNWNSTADNGMDVNFGAGDVLTHLIKYMPTVATIDGVITRDYNTTAQFSMSSTVYGAYYENVTKVTESTSNNVYNLQINHTPAQYGAGTIPYTTTNADLLNADFTNPATLSTNNPNASLSSTLPDFTINTGYVAAGVEYYYLIQQPYFYPPQSLTSIADINHIHFDWDDQNNIDYWNISRLVTSIPYTPLFNILDGLEDVCYDLCAYGIVDDAPNPSTDYGIELIYIVRNNTYLMIYADGEDNDAFSNDDNFIIGIDASNNNLTTDDRKFILNEGGTVTAKRWSGTSWLPTSTNSQGVVIGAGVAGSIQYEIFIPISELDTNFTNSSTVKFFMARSHTASNPDDVSYYPHGLINTTDAALWQAVSLTPTQEYEYIANSTLSNYTISGLDPFTWYKHKFTTINGSQETTGTFSTNITGDTPSYSISGYVNDSSGNPISNAFVWLEDGVVQNIGYTNVSGYFSTIHVHTGNYTLWANATGYQQNNIDIIVSGNLTNQNVTMTAFEMTDWMLWAKLLEIEDKIDALSSDFTPTEGNYEMLSSTYNIFLLLLGACFILSFPKRGEVTERDTGLNNVLFSFIGTILSMFLAQIIVSGQVVESFEFASQIYDPLQHYLLYMVAIIMFIIFVLNILYYAKQRWE